MHSIKPGRGPSIMGGIGAIAAGIFGVIWMSLASSMGAPTPFVLFGLVFVAMAIIGAMYNFYNAGAKNRMSEFDITTHHEESDPISNALGHTPPAEQRHSPSTETAPSARKFRGGFCPFCGERVEPQFEYCPKCGKDI